MAGSLDVEERHSGEGAVEVRRQKWGRRIANHQSAREKGKKATAEEEFGACFEVYLQCS